MRIKLSGATMTLALIMGQTSMAFAATPMPTMIKDHISKLASSGDSCVIATFTPSYFGNIQGVSDEVAVGMISLDSENCAGAGMAPPSTSVVAYKIDGQSYQKIALPPALSAIPVQEIISVTPHPESFTLKVLYRGPNDPLCCAQQKGIFGITVNQ